MSHYTSNQTGKAPGIFIQPPYYCSESERVVESWHYNVDTSHNYTIAQARLSQASATKASMIPEDVSKLPCTILHPPVNFRANRYARATTNKSTGGLRAMTAAETCSFPTPSTSPSYIRLDSNVFNNMASPHWNTSTCNESLQRQSTPTNPGFYYQPSIANGVLFQLAARLARLRGIVRFRIGRRRRRFGWRG